ncbi:MAG: class I SAM-dependent methyltransferase [Bacteroidia bacterium]|jgi:SAM-dependent methyltransferase
MNGFWEEKYKANGLLWTFEPAESAINTCRLFAEKGFRKILIPGVGYGRNAHLFVDKGFEVTGIEISGTAIRLAREHGLDFPIHNGSVAQMPFDETIYDGIFCYALLHLLNQNERRQFLKNCFNQLRLGGIMVFIIVSKEYRLFENGKLVSKNRYRIEKGLAVFFYDSESIEKEFGLFGLVEYTEIDEPVRHLENEVPMKFYRVICRKNQD